MTITDASATWLDDAERAIGAAVKSQVARVQLFSFSSLPASLLVRCLYRPGEFFGQLIGWLLQLAVTGLRRRRGWIRVGHRRHAGHRDQPPANFHPLARSWKASFFNHAQSRCAADAE